MAFTTISLNVERGIVKILFKYRYFQDLLIDIDIDIDISLILLIDIDIDIDIFQNHHIDIDIDIDIFGIALSISISISIFSNMTISISISISIFFKSVDISTIDMSYRYIEQGYFEFNVNATVRRAGDEQVWWRNRRAATADGRRTTGAGQAS